MHNKGGWEVGRLQPFCILFIKHNQWPVSSSQRFLGSPGVWQPSSSILRYTSAGQTCTLKSFNWLVTGDCCEEGRAVVVRESSLQASPFPQSPLSWSSPSSWISGSDLGFPSIHVLFIAPSAPSQDLPTPVLCFLLIWTTGWWQGSSLCWFSEANQTLPPPGKRDLYVYKKFWTSWCQSWLVHPLQSPSKLLSSKWWYRMHCGVVWKI